MRIVEPLLGTRAEVSVLGTHGADTDATEAAIVEEVSRLEGVFSVFDDSSALCELRRTGVTASPELLAVIELADEWRSRTAGSFDADLGALMRLWDDAEQRDRLPSELELRAAIDERERQRSSRANLNLNAIAKGWIVGTALGSIFAESPELDMAWLSVGGDVVHQGTGSVRVGIENPARPYDNVAPMAMVDLANEALATSGGSRRWWTIGGEKFSKVLDPRTGRPATSVASATVIASDAAVADVLATAALVVTPSEALAMTASAGADCLLVHHDGSTSSSSNRFELV